MPSLNQWVDAHYANASHRFAVKLAVDDGRQGCMNVNRTDAQCVQAWRAKVLMPPGHLNFHFIGFDRARVDSFGPCLTQLRQMVTTARGQVGGYDTFSDSKYEQHFGTRAWHGSSATKKAGVAAGNAASLSGFEQRAQFVRAKFNQLYIGLDEVWLIKYSDTPGEVAAFGGIASNVISIGRAFPLGVPGYFHAGTLIHEMGHNHELSDVCQICHKPQLDNSTHFVNFGRLRMCDANTQAAHGALATQNNGHYINGERVRLLAKTHKNMTVYNTDSYRAFCCSFVLAEHNAGFAEHERLKALRG